MDSTDKRDSKVTIRDSERGDSELPNANAKKAERAEQLFSSFDKPKPHPMGGKHP